MLEVILIFSIIYACLFMPLRGKTFEQLSDSQKQRVRENYDKYMKTAKGKQTPEMTVEQYLPILAKQGLIYMIVAIVLIPIYILVVIFLYSYYFFA